MRRPKLLIGSALLMLVIGGAGYQRYFSGTTHQIIRTPDGYEPAILEIKRGDTIEFINQSGNFHWPASDIHPTHGVYPAFDPRRPVAADEVWEFRFNQVGVWEFHDHLHANEVGTITVVE